MFKKNISSYIKIALCFILTAICSLCAFSLVVKFTYDGKVVTLPMLWTMLIISITLYQDYIYYVRKQSLELFFPDTITMLTFSNWKYIVACASAITLWTVLLSIALGNWWLTLLAILILLIGIGLINLHLYNEPKYFIKDSGEEVFLDNIL